MADRRCVRCRHLAPHEPAGCRTCRVLGLEPCPRHVRRAPWWRIALTRTLRGLAG